MKIISLKNKTFYRVILGLLLAVSLLVLIRLAPIFLQPQYLLSDDYVRYWASGKINLQGSNPYDPLLIRQFQSSLGGDINWPDITSITLTPPWAIPIVMLFALIAYPASRIIWLLISAVILLFSTQLLWNTFNGPSQKRWLALLAGLIFAPTISVLEKGQVTLLILLGLAGFIYFVSAHRNDWLAGASLALVAIKPQVVPLLWLVLLFWVLQERRWLILSSACLFVSGLTLISLAFNPHIIQQYFTMLQTYHISDWAVPTIGAYLRFFWLGIDKFWVQFLPTIIGVVWLIVYWVRNHTAWSWKKEMPVILFVSILCSPYAWTYDQVVLIPVVIQAVIWIVLPWKQWPSIVLAIIFLGLNLLNLLLHTRLDDFWFVWSAPALFIWYICTRWYHSSYRADISLARQTAD